MKKIYYSIANYLLCFAPAVALTLGGSFEIGLITICSSVLIMIILDKIRREPSRRFPQFLTFIFFTSLTALFLSEIIPQISNINPVITTIILVSTCLVLFIACFLREKEGPASSVLLGENAVKNNICTRVITAMYKLIKGLLCSKNLYTFALNIFKFGNSIIKSVFTLKSNTDDKNKDSGKQGFFNKIASKINSFSKKHPKITTCAKYITSLAGIAAATFTTYASTLTVLTRTMFPSIATVVISMVVLTSIYELLNFTFRELHKKWNINRDLFFSFEAVRNDFELNNTCETQDPLLEKIKLQHDETNRNYEKQKKKTNNLETLKNIVAGFGILSQMLLLVPKTILAIASFKLINSYLKLNNSVFLPLLITFLVINTISIIITTLNVFFPDKDHDKSPKTKTSKFSIFLWIIFAAVILYNAIGIFATEFIQTFSLGNNTSQSFMIFIICISSLYSISVATNWLQNYSWAKIIWQKNVTKKSNSEEMFFPDATKPSLTNTLKSSKIPECSNSNGIKGSEGNQQPNPIRVADL